MSKFTRVYLEHKLNGVGAKLKRDEIEACSDKFYDTWLKSGTIRRLGAWLRKEYPEEFKKRYASFCKADNKGK